MDQAKREVAAEAVASLDRPHVFGELLCGGQHFSTDGMDTSWT
ncbi:hypothetical protein [Nocardia sp. NPDC059239]